MTLPYSKALREQIVKSVTSGISRRTTAQLFDVSIGFVVKLMIRWHSEGTTEPKQMYLRVLAPHADRIKAIVFAQPSLTVDGIHKLLEVEGIRASRVTLFRFLNSIGLTRKRRKALRQGVIKQKKARGSPAKADHPRVMPSM